MATISLCMIVKNEEAVLERCLASIADLMDEIIIIDTGSTDRTKEIAARYTDKIYDYVWINDFSDARNFSFSKATMDYIYTADADEVLDAENHRRFAFLKQSLMPEIEIVQMKYITPDEYNTVMNISNEYRPKLYRRLRQFCWIDPVHETVRTKPLVFDSDIEILHLPQSQHSGRDFELFLHIFGNGQPLSDKLHTMYARELFISGTDSDFRKAQPVFEQTLLEASGAMGQRPAGAGSAGRLAEAVCVLCRCMRMQKKREEFFKYALRSIAYHPCAEISCELGDYYSQAGDFEEAARWYYCAAYETDSILDVHTGGDIPLRKLAQCYSCLAETDTAMQIPYLTMAEGCRKEADEWEMPQEMANS